VPSAEQRRNFIYYFEREGWEWDKEYEKDKGKEEMGIRMTIREK
jgi:hypothetical protein